MSSVNLEVLASTERQGEGLRVSTACSSVSLEAHRAAQAAGAMGGSEAGAAVGVQESRPPHRMWRGKENRPQGEKTGELNRRAGVGIGAKS